MRLLLGFLLVSTPAWAQDVQGGVRLREWLCRYDGAITAEGPADNGTRLDAGSDLGLDRFEPAHEIQASVDVGSVGRFSIGYWRLRFEGSEVLDADTTFNGLTFPAGTAVESKLRFDVVPFDYELPLLDQPVQIGALAGIRYFSAEAELRGGGQDEHAKIHRPLLLPGAHVGLQVLPWLRADARALGLAFSAHNLQCRYAELEAEVVGIPVDRFFVGLGYRHLITYFKARKDSLDFDLDGSLGGPYLSLEYRF